MKKILIKLINFYQKEIIGPKSIYIPNSLSYWPKKTAKLNNNNIISIGRLSQEKGFLDLIDVFKSLGKYDLYIERISWCILEYKLVSVLNREHSFSELRDFYPESHNYIWTNVFLDFKSKIFLTLYKMRLDFFADIILLLYHFRKEGRFNSRLLV